MASCAPSAASGLSGRVGGRGELEAATSSALPRFSFSVVAPLLAPLNKPMLAMGKISFIGAHQVPRVAFTIATLMLLPRVITNYSEGLLAIKDKNTAKLASEIFLLGSFAGAVLLRDGATPLDMAVPAVLTTLTFALPHFDKLSRFMFEADFPQFKWTRDIVVLASVIFSTWFSMMLAYGTHMPVLKQMNDTLRRMISGNPDLRFITKSIEFGLLCLVPTVIRRYSKKQDKDVGYTSGFLVALLARHMIPTLRIPGSKYI